MADAILITIAEAIADELTTASAAGEFNRGFEAGVVWANRTVELEDRGILHVDVAAINWSELLDARGELGQCCRYDVGVRKRFEVEEQEQSTGEISDNEVTELVTLLSDLLRFFMPKQPSKTGRELAGVPDASWAPEKNEKTGEMKTEVMIDWDHLRTMRQFTGYFRLTFEVCS